MSKKKPVKADKKTDTKSKKKKLTDEEMRAVSGGLRGALTQAVRKPAA